MSVSIAYSTKSKPSALVLQAEGAEIVRDSSIEVLVNWGRYRANAKLNPDISNSTNKYRMRQLFAEHGVPAPKLYTTREAIEQIESGETLVGRPDQHSKGRGFWLVNNRYALTAALQGTRRKKAATHFMEYIEFDREYRVHIFDGKSIRVSLKEPDDTPRGWTARKPGDIKLAKVRDAAKLAVKAVGLDFGAVDVMARGEQNNEVWVSEVNAAPGIGGSMPAVYMEQFKKQLEGENNEA